MSSLSEYLPWLHTELDFARNTLGRDDAEQGQDRVGNYERLIEDIQKMQPHGSEVCDLTTGSGGLGALLKSPGILDMQVLEGLPQEIVEQVRVGETEKFEAGVMKLLRAANGQPMLLDNILIGLYLMHRESYKRAQLNNKLYRMVTKGLISSVPGKKGLYTVASQDEVESASSK